MPQPATFGVKALARLDDITMYWRTLKRPMKDQKNMAPHG